MISRQTTVHKQFTRCCGTLGFISHSQRAFLSFCWLSAPLGGRAVRLPCLSRRMTAVAHHRPPPHPPQPTPSFMIHLATPSHCLVPLFTTSKQCFTHYPWADAALLWTTLTFRCYLEPLGHQGQHLTYIFTASGLTVFSPSFAFSFSHFLLHYCCLVRHAAHRAVNCSLSGTSGPLTCTKKGKVGGESQSIQGDIFSHHSYSFWWIS